MYFTTESELVRILSYFIALTGNSVLFAAV